MILRNLLSALTPTTIKLRRAEKAAREAEFERRKKLREEFEERTRIQNNIRSFPVYDMSQEELDQLPRNVGTEFLKTCPIGTWIRCTPHPFAPNEIVIGQVVKGMDAFVDQWGAGMSPPERFLNRYRVHITEFWKKESEVATAEKI